MINPNPETQTSITNSPKIVLFSDVDLTLIDNDNDENSNLINLFKFLGINVINFFTNMSYNCIAEKYGAMVANDTKYLSRENLKDLLKKEHNIQVPMVITPADVSLARGPGVTYEEIILPAYVYFLTPDNKGVTPYEKMKKSMQKKEDQTEAEKEVEERYKREQAGVAQHLSETPKFANGKKGSLFNYCRGKKITIENEITREKREIKCQKPIINDRDVVLFFDDTPEEITSVIAANDDETEMKKVELVAIKMDKEWRTQTMADLLVNIWFCIQKNNLKQTAEALYDSTLKAGIYQNSVEGRAFINELAQIIGVRRESVSKNTVNSNTSETDEILDLTQDSTSAKFLKIFRVPGRRKSSVVEPNDIGFTEDEVQSIDENIWVLAKLKFALKNCDVSLFKSEFEKVQSNKLILMQLSKTLPFHSIIESGGNIEDKKTLITLLLKKDPKIFDINQCNTQGKTVLHLLLIKHDYNFMEFLEKNGGDKSLRALYELQSALIDGEVRKFIKTFDRIKSDKSILKGLAQIYPFHTIIQSSISTKKKEILIELLLNTASNIFNIDECNNDGDTAAHLAVKKHDYGVLTCLVKNDINLSLTNNGKETAKDLAISQNELPHYNASTVRTSIEAALYQGGMTI